MRFFKKDPPKKCWYNHISRWEHKDVWQAEVWYSRESQYHRALSAWSELSQITDSKAFDSPEEARDWLDTWGERFREWAEYIIPLTKVQKYCEN